MDRGPAQRGGGAAEAGGSFPQRDCCPKGPTAEAAGATGGGHMQMTRKICKHHRAGPCCLAVGIRAKAQSSRGGARKASPSQAEPGPSSPSQGQAQRQTARSCC